MRPDDLNTHPNALASHYSRFRVAERLLLTGHSHQAWPDCGFEAQQQSWLDAAAYVDDKWLNAEAKAEEVRNGYRRLLGEPGADVALGQNTQELVVRLLSALPFARRPRIVSTDGEFHSLRRLLDRLSEERWLEVVKVPIEPVDTLVVRLAAQANEKTSAVLCSSVLFQSARIVPGLPDLAAACAKRGAELLVDAYHQMNVVPFDIHGLESAFVVGGGYKYCQLGEGVCFLRVPPGCRLRPITTGWFTEFGALADDPAGKVVYGAGGGRFEGATYDPTSHYRAAAVFDFHARHGLTPVLLREVSQNQVGLLADRFDALDLDPAVITRDRSTPLNMVGGFLTLTSEDAGDISSALKQDGVRTDSRGRSLRLGPAPYLSDSQLHESMDTLASVIERLQ